MVDQKWREITDALNALGAGSSPLSVDKVQKKLFDLKFTSKKTVNKYKCELRQTGGGTNNAKQPTESQFAIADIIGKAYTECIAGADLCDIAHEWFLTIIVNPAAVGLQVQIQQLQNALSKLKMKKKFHLNVAGSPNVKFKTKN